MPSTWHKTYPLVPLMLLWWRDKRRAGTEASFWTSHQRRTGKSSSFQFSFVYFFLKHLKKRPLGSYEKDFLALVGALSEEEDEWDKVSIALALTPDRGTVLHCQELFYWYFSLGGKKKTLTIPHPPIVLFFFQDFPAMRPPVSYPEGNSKRGIPPHVKILFCDFKKLISWYWSHSIAY